MRGRRRVSAATLRGIGKQAEYFNSILISCARERYAGSVRVWPRAPAGPLSPHSVDRLIVLAAPCPVPLLS